MRMKLRSIPFFSKGLLVLAVLSSAACLSNDNADGVRGSADLLVPSGCIPDDAGPGDGDDDDDDDDEEPAPNCGTVNCGPDQRCDLTHAEAPVCVGLTSVWVADADPTAPEGTRALLWSAEDAPAANGSVWEP